MDTREYFVKTKHYVVRLLYISLCLSYTQHIETTLYHIVIYT